MSRLALTQSCWRAAGCTRHCIIASLARRPSRSAPLIKNTGAESIALEVGSTDLEEKNAVGRIEFNNVHVVQERDMFTVKLAEVAPGALEGFLDLAGQITISNPHGDRKTISPPIKDPKRITLKLNEELLTDE